MTENALKRWQEKKQFLETELATTSNPAQKFELRQQIEDCETNIQRLSQPPKRIEPINQEGLRSQGNTTQATGNRSAAIGGNVKHSTIILGDGNLVYRSSHLDRGSMDISQLVKILTPYLPSLMEIGQKALDTGAERLGEKGAEGLVSQAQIIWQKLWPLVQAKPAAQEAAADVAIAPENEDAVASLRQQLKKILEAPENQALAAEVAKILAEPDATGAAKFNVRIENSQIGAIGDNAAVTMNVGTPPDPKN